MSLETRDLYFRTYQPRDFAAFFRLHSDEFVCEHLVGGPRDEDQCLEMFELMLEGEVHAYGVFSRSSHEYVGHCSLESTEFREAEITFLFFQKFWGMGYGEQTLEFLISRARPLGLMRLTAVLNEENRAGRRVLERKDFNLDIISDTENGEVLEFHRDLC